MYECDLCPKTFDKRSSLVQHRRRVHVNKNRYQCAQCDYSVQQKHDLVKHNQRQHSNDSSSSKKVIKQYSCLLCDVHVCKDRKGVIEHYIEQHDVRLHEKVFSFKCMAGFDDWKRNVEQNSVCQFVHSQGPKNRAGFRVQYFRCFRNGDFRSQSKGLRRSKLKGSNKINGVCPASIKAVENKVTGAVDVTFMPDHIGHFQELGRLNLTKEEKAEIARKLSAKVPFQEVVNQIGQVASGSVGDKAVRRIHLTTRKDLWNIKKSYKLDEKREGSPSGNDRAIEEATIEPSEQESDLVRFYNSQSASLLTTPELDDNEINERKLMIRSKVEEILERVATREQLEIFWNALLPIAPAILLPQ